MHLNRRLLIYNYAPQHLSQFSTSKVKYRSIFFCVDVINFTLLLRKQKNAVPFFTKRLKSKTCFIFSSKITKPTLIGRVIRPKYIL